MYEQELDSLLWKIDYKDVVFSENTPILNSKSKVLVSCCVVKELSHSNNVFLSQKEI